MPYRANHNPLYKAGGCYACRIWLPVLTCLLKDSNTRLCISTWTVSSLFNFVDYIALYLVHRRHNYIIANNGIIGNCFSEVFAPAKQVVFVDLRVTDLRALVLLIGGFINGNRTN